MVDILRDEKIAMKKMREFGIVTFMLVHEEVFHALRHVDIHLLETSVEVEEFVLLLGLGGRVGRVLAGREGRQYD